MSVIDLFAGPGGWDLAALELGIEPLGVEFDDAACATREAAGLKTLQADVGALDPSEFGPIDGLIASPPCQAFSMAGKGEGRKAIETYVDAIEAIGRGEVVDRKSLDQACGDERAHLVLEPLRWALALNPDWIALEQVEPVLPIWEALGGVFRDMGYSVWTGVLSAEQYGVPQTRRRAFLIASKVGEVQMPPPTHQRYVAPRIKQHEKQEATLFDGGGRTRIVAPGEQHLKPWVSMAEALGWIEGPSPSPSPSPTLTAGGGATGGIEPFASKAARERAAGAVAFKKPYGEGMVDRHGDRDGRPADSPAPVITEKARSAEWQMRANAQANAAIRDQNEPAPTIKGGYDTAERVWEPTHYDARQSKDAGNIPRPVTEPAPTMLAEGLAKGVPRWTEDRPSPTVVTTRRSEDGALIGRQLPEGEGKNVGGKNWVEGRPATTVAGDQRVFQPGGHHQPGEQSQNAVRVTQQEAAVLQSFPPDYPWQGSKTKQFQQIGNAVPPLLALAVLAAVVPNAAELEAAA